MTYSGRINNKSYKKINVLENDIESIIDSVAYIKKIKRWTRHAGGDFFVVKRCRIASMHESIMVSVASPVLDRNLFIYVSVCVFKSTVSFSTITGLLKPKNIPYIVQ